MTHLVEKGGGGGGGGAGGWGERERDWHTYIHLDGQLIPCSIQFLFRVFWLSVFLSSHVVRGQILAERVQERAEALERQLSELDTLQTNDAT